VDIYRVDLLWEGTRRPKRGGTIVALGRLTSREFVSWRMASVATRGITAIFLSFSSGFAVAQTSSNSASTLLVKAGRLRDVNTGDYRIDQGY